MRHQQSKQFCDNAAVGKGRFRLFARHEPQLRAAARDLGGEFGDEVGERDAVALVPVARADADGVSRDLLVAEDEHEAMPRAAKVAPPIEIFKIGRAHV